MEGCYLLALSFDAGRGVEQDKQRAVELYAQACKGGQDLACAKGALTAHYRAMLKELDAGSVASCRGAAPRDAIRMTVRVLRLNAGASELPRFDLNITQEPPNVVSAQAANLSTLTGEAWLKEAQSLLAAPATLVVEVKSEVQAEVVLGSFYGDRFSSSGRFKPGSLTVRLVRFDAKAKPTCATEVTLKNEPIELEHDESVAEAAGRQLRERVSGALGL